MKLAIDPEKIIFADLDPTEAVVLNLETKNYYKLNETGIAIWKGLDAGRSPAEIAAEIARAYDVAEAEARADVDALVARLRMESILTAGSVGVYSIEKAHAAKMGKQPLDQQK